MKVRCLAFICVYLFAFGCLAQSVKHPKNVDGAVAPPIIDSFEQPVFVLKRENIFVVLPTALGGSNAKGWAAVEALLDENGRLKGVSLNKLLVKLPSGTIINYFGKQQLHQNLYSGKIRPYYVFVRQYADKLAFLKVGKAAHLNSTQFIVKFGME